MIETATTMADRPKSTSSAFFGKKRKSITQALFPRMKSKREITRNAPGGNVTDVSSKNSEVITSEVLQSNSLGTPLLGSRSMQSIQRDILNWVKNDQSVATLLSQNNYSASNYSRISGSLRLGKQGRRRGSTESGNSILDSRNTAYANELIIARDYKGEGPSFTSCLRGSRAGSMRLDELGPYRATCEYYKNEDAEAKNFVEARSVQRTLSNSIKDQSSQSSSTSTSTSNQLVRRSSKNPSQRHIDMLRSCDSLGNAFAQDAIRYDTSVTHQVVPQHSRPFENTTIASGLIATIRKDVLEAELLAMAGDCSDDDFRKNENWYAFGASKDFSQNMEMPVARRRSAPNTTLPNMRGSSGSIEANHRLVVSSEVVRERSQGNSQTHTRENSASRYSKLPSLTPSQETHHKYLPVVYPGSSRQMLTPNPDGPTRTNTIFNFDDDSMQCSKTDTIPCMQAQSASIPRTIAHEIAYGPMKPAVKTCYSTGEHPPMRHNHNKQSSDMGKISVLTDDSDSASSGGFSSSIEKRTQNSLYSYDGDRNVESSVGVCAARNDDRLAPPSCKRSHTVTTPLPGCDKPIPKPRPKSAQIETHSEDLYTTMPDSDPTSPELVLQSASLPSVRNELTYLQSVMRDGSELRVVPVTMPLPHGINGNAMPNIVGLVISTDPVIHSPSLEQDKNSTALRANYQRQLQEAVRDSTYVAQSESTPNAINPRVAAAALDMNFVGKSSVEVFRTKVDSHTPHKKQKGAYSKRRSLQSDAPAKCNNKSPEKPAFARDRLRSRSASTPDSIIGKDEGSKARRRLSGLLSKFKRMQSGHEDCEELAEA